MVEIDGPLGSVVVVGGLDFEVESPINKPIITTDTTRIIAGKYLFEFPCGGKAFAELKCAFSGGSCCG
jgi:hypothetical protein